MKFFTLINGCLTIVPLVLGCGNIYPGLAQSIIPASNATGTLVTPVGNKYNINGGMLSGDRTNLFHSFDKFGLSAGETANFISNPQIRNILGRVTGGNASLINGLIQVTGGKSNLFLINPAGIVFGTNASLNVPASFTATTATGIGFSNNQWFNAFGSNNYQNLIGIPSQFAFDLAKSGNIINAGKLAVPTGENLTLLGGNVINTGELTAASGNITISAVPNQNVVKISQPGNILSLEIVPPRDITGQILPINPVDLPTLLTGTAKNIDTGLSVNPFGHVQLNQSGMILPNQQGLAITAGNISVAGIKENSGGGNVNILGDKVGVFNSNIDASGPAGGGRVRVGGDYQGGGTLPHATQTIIAPDANINANATGRGNGGEVIVWSDNLTQYYGNITARGGVNGGDGGLVETSGKDLLIFTGGVDAGAILGKAGTLLLDPKNITITNASSPLATILNPNLVAGGNFGSSVAISGSNLLVGAAGNTSGGVSGAGQAYLFNTSGGLLQTFNNPNPVAIGQFGSSVAISGSNLLIGAWGNTSGGVSQAGQAYLFNTSGGLLQTFNNPNPLPSGRFGYSVAISGSNLLVGAWGNTSGGVSGAGQAYLFNTSGGLLQTFNNPNPVPNGTFGDSVAISGSNLLVGASGNTSGGVLQAGQAYLFNTSGGLLQTFDNPNPLLNGRFGYSVAISGSNLLVGALNNTLEGVSGAGQAYLFNTSGGLLQTFNNPNPASQGYFGGSVAISGSNLLVGAFGNTSGGVSGAGQAFLFNPSGGLLQTFDNPNPGTFSGNFGYSVAISGNNLLFGAILNTSGGVSQAGQTFFEIPAYPGVLSFSDNPSYSVNVNPADITRVTNTGTNVVLKANNDLTVAQPVITSAGGNGGAFTLQAGHSILVNGNITTDNGNLTLVANETAANGVQSQYRDSGSAYITVAPGVTLNSGTGDTTIRINTGTATGSSGNISLQNIIANNLLVENLGASNSNIILNTPPTLTGNITLTANGSVTTPSITTPGNSISITSNLGQIDTTSGTLDTSSTSQGGDVTLTANHLGVMTGNINSNSTESGTGGNITITSGDAIDTTLGTLNSSSGTGKGGDITLNANSNIQIANLNTTSNGSGAGGNITLNTTGGLITNPVGTITSTSNSGQGGNISLASSSDIIINKNINSSSNGTGKGGDISLTSTLGAVQINALTSTSAFGNGGNLTINAANDIKGLLLFADATKGQGGNISLTSTTGAINMSSLSANSNNAQGGTLFLQANGNITTGDLSAKGITGISQGGQISIISKNAAIAVGNITTTGATSGGNISVQASTQITTKQIDSSSMNGAGGNVLIDPTGDVQVSNINTSGQTTGGNVDITAGTYLRVNVPLTTTNCGTVSICTIGNTQGGNIILRHGGNGITPFVVGDATTNGTASALDQGNGTEQTITSGSFLNTLVQDNGTLAIITNSSSTTPSTPSILSTPPISLIPSTPSTPSIPITPSTSGTVSPISSGIITPISSSTPSSILTSIPTPISSSSSSSIPSNHEQQNLTINPVDLTKLPNQLEILPSINSDNSQNIAVDKLISQEYTRYFGLPDSQEVSVGKIQKSLGNIETNTGTKPALIYAVFVPSTITPISSKNGMNIANDQFDNQLGLLRSSTQEKRDRLELILVTPNAKPIRRSVNITREEVIQTAINFQNAVTDQTLTKEYFEPAKKMYQWLVAPLESALQKLQIQNLVYVMDKQLRTIPLAAMYDGKNFLIEHYSVGLMPSFALTDTSYYNIHNSPVLAMGSKTFLPSAHLPSLPYVGEEISLINKIRGGKTFLNHDFTIENLKAEREHIPFRIVHLATHADFNPGNVNDSYIYFAQENLRLANLRSIKWNHPPVELLVLSACKTAIGNEDAELGFAGLAVKTGVKSVLASLWYISDQGTLGLMTEFYEQLKTAPIKAEALRRAQLAMMRGEVRLESGKLVTSQQSFPLPPELVKFHPQFSHPYFWSGFTIIGNPW